MGRAEVGIDQALAATGERLRAGDLVSARDMAAEIVRFAVSLIAEDRLGECETILARLADMLPTHGPTLHHQGVCRQLAGDPAQAEALIRRALALEPDRAEAWTNLGVALLAQGDADQAVDCFRRALRRAPDNAHALNNLGAVLLRRQDWAEARSVLERALRIAPETRGAAVNLAVALAGEGAYGRAMELCADVIRREPDNLDAHLCLANAQAKLGHFERAIATLRQALAFGPAPQAVNNLANLLQSEGRTVEAVAAYRGILDADPDNAAVWSNMAGALVALGSIDQAIEAYGQSLRLKPDAQTHSNLLIALPYRSGVTAASLLADARRWDETHGRAERCLHLNIPDPARRLRIGYLSPDFRRHAAGYFLAAIVTAHDRSAVEIYGYFDHPQADDLTAQVRAAVDHWRPVHGMSNATLIEQIQGDGIDILVECAGHAAGNRLVALARKPAPIQVTSLLGHGGTTGMAAMDCVLADKTLAPEGSEREFSEAVVRLPIFAPFQPDPAWPGVSPLPEGPPVLACVGGPWRIGDDLLDLWARILERVPEARLLLKNSAYDEPGQAAHWRARFAALGDRLILEGVPGGWSRHMEVYGRIALALDTFPATGATSTLIPLWMGVPVVSRAGDHAGQRFGAAILGAAGLPDLVARTGAAYVEKAAALAIDRPRLAALRGALRQRLANGVVCDAAGYAREAEAAYRILWRRWCENEERGRT